MYWDCQKSIEIGRDVKRLQVLHWDCQRCRLLEIHWNCHKCIEIVRDAWRLSKMDRDWQRCNKIVTDVLRLSGKHWGLQRCTEVAGDALRLKTIAFLTSRKILKIPKSPEKSQKCSCFPLKVRKYIEIVRYALILAEMQRNSRGHIEVAGDVSRL